MQVNSNYQCPHKSYHSNLWNIVYNTRNTKDVGVQCEDEAGTADVPTDGQSSHKRRRLCGRLDLRMSFIYKLYLIIFAFRNCGKR